MQTAFITGAGSGFGFALARRLLGLGWRVVATDPEPERLAPLHGPHLLALPLDVRDAAAVRRAADAAGPVDLLVNNGGYAVFGTVEEADLDAIAALFDVNVLGVARVTQALLPALRARRGAIVNLSSVAGRMAFTESGYYAATKHAIEALSEALHAEVGHLGVRVVVIEPGSFDTRFLQTARERSKPRDPASPYADRHATWDARKLEVLAAPQDPERVVDAIVAALADPRPFLRVPVGEDGVSMLNLRDALPPDTWTGLLAWRVGAAPLPAPLLGPTEALAALAAGREDAPLRLTRAAARAGYLSPWADEIDGPAALAALRR
jgi:NAD(P)-dependent dehydrogenase (short-subunit alcohol dehydrogenase family)